MAQPSIQRAASKLSWSLMLSSRSHSRSVVLTFSRNPPPRHSESRGSLRTFSTATRRSQATAAASSPKVAADKTPKSSTEARTSTTRAGGGSTFPTARHEATSPSLEPIHDVTKGLSDQPFSQPSDNAAEHIDWTKSFHGMSAEPFPKEVADILLQPLNEDDVEVKPDGIVYLPEIKYRRILNRAFGPGGWGLAPRGETIVTPKSVTREYALLANGRLVSIARGEQDYFDPEGIATATEGCKSNALMRCCKDLGVASELWDPRFIRKFMAAKARETWVEHVVTKKRRKIHVRKDDEVRYPYKEVKGTGASGAFA